MVAAIEWAWPILQDIRSPRKTLFTHWTGVHAVPDYAAVAMALPGTGMSRYRYARSIAVQVVLVTT